jgi:ABC-type polysaccharide/polyol phosphate export permease
MHELVIEPGRAEKNYWRDLWRYRELFYFLAWRDILVRYKQTVIGIAWPVIRLYCSLLHARKEVEVLRHQRLRSGTSFVAHVREAPRASS